MSSDPSASVDQPPSTAVTTPPRNAAARFTRTGALWIALIMGFLVLIVLLVFVAENTEPVDVVFFGWHTSLPLGVALLLAAVGGGLVSTLVAAARIVQLRLAAKKNLARR